MQANLLLAASRNATRQTSSVTWNPSDKGSNTTLSNGSLTATFTLGSGVRSTAAHSTGRHMFELTMGPYENGVYSPVIGIATSATGLTSGWTTTGEYLYYDYTQGSPIIIYNANSRFSYGLATAPNDVVGVALDCSGANPILTFYKNGVSMGTMTGAGTLPNASYYAYAASPDGGAGFSSSVVANFGNSPFKYPITNFSVW